jgi:DNA-binding transcriptional MerR regulator
MTQERRKTYSISETEQLTGVSQRQLRYWESRGYIPKMDRVVCGDISYRYFTQDHIRIIREIKIFMDQGFTLSHASMLAKSRIYSHSK